MKKGINDKTIEVESPSWYASHWGLTDLYPGAEELLRELLDSGKDFRTTWWGAKKEIAYAKYEADRDELSVMAKHEMDDLWDGEHDLIWDAISDLQAWGKIPSDWEADDDFTDYVLNCIMDYDHPADIEDYAISTEFLSRTASYEELMKATSKAWDAAYAKCNKMYEDLKEIVLNCYSFCNHN